VILPPPPRRSEDVAVPGLTFTAPAPVVVPTKQGAKRLRALLEELVKRDMEALKVYVPFGQALAFHQSQAKVRLLLG
jgi:hypothetical protein